MDVFPRLAVVLLMTPGLVFAQPRHSPYVGQEQRQIKALSDAELQALLDGRGLGLAKAAELNHYPGPMHVLELATQLHLSEAQRTATQQIYDRMRAEAVRLGQQIVAQERELDRLFADHNAAGPKLQAVVREIARLQGELRLVHLQAHVDMKALLSPEQVATYDALRGYGTPAHPSAPLQHRHGRQ
ncbi:MAG TPA: Spy/CpxP family protein refolding chaperone [Alphaproteobacteria bacterium]|nr:Spy/CpxP family protein refolding chaperone [Alphaproteobacteria bacterium]